MIEKMPDLPLKPGRKLADHRSASEVERDEWLANRRKPRAATPKATWEGRKADAERKVARAHASTHKKLDKKASLQGAPAYKESQHPRDRFGRFAVKAVKSTVKGVGKVVKGTAKVVNGTHKVVKRAYANARRDDALAHRERKLDLHKREVSAGLKKPKTTRRKKATPAKKQGLLGRLFSPPKKTVRRRKR